MGGEPLLENSKHTLIALQVIAFVLWPRTLLQPWPHQSRTNLTPDTQQPTDAGQRSREEAIVGDAEKVEQWKKAADAVMISFVKRQTRDEVLTAAYQFKEDEDHRRP